MNLTEKQITNFWNKINIQSKEECWNWGGCKIKTGYGCVMLNGKIEKAHRVSYYLKHGDIPEDMYVCHTCDNPSCVNPDHLFVGTQKDNMQDMISKGRACDRKGTANPKNKFTEEQVIAIRNDDRPYSQIAKDYNTNKSRISEIKLYKTWRHL